jgi:diguanylate cyclase (GGDEF)-like protein
MVRLSLAVLAVAGLGAVGADGPPVANWAVLLVGYLGVVATVEVVRRSRGRPAVGLVTPLVLLDGIMLAIVVAASGGTAGPLEVLIVLHVVAMALTVSGRTGLEAAIWHATLLLVVTAPVEAAPGGSNPLYGHVAAYVVAGAVVAVLAAADRGVARRRGDRMAAQVRLSARLQPVVATEEACAALAAHVTMGGFARCAVLVAGSSHVTGAVAEGDHPPVLVTAPLPRERGRLLSAAAGPDPVLARFLDARVDPLLDRLLPGAMNIVGVPIVADGSALGVAVAEWRPGKRARIPEGVVEALRGDAGHCGLALRSVLLLEQVEHRSRRDLLTGLVNRRGFDEALDRELSRVERSATSVSLTLIDLDNFKAVNDSLGHQAGDRVLAAVGVALSRVARAQDVAARIGGDEFALLLPDCGSDTARLVADRVLAAVATTVGHQGVTASIGVATAPRHGGTRRAVVRSADEALYAAKGAGRNRSVVSSRREPHSEPVLVLDATDRHGRPHRRADLKSRVLHPAGREALGAERIGERRRARSAGPGPERPGAKRHERRNASGG